MWQLCLADGSETPLGEDDLPKDERIRYQHLGGNRGIAGNTNAALQMAEGDFVVFADHDDMLAPDALYSFAELLRDHGDMDVIYSDETRRIKRERSFMILISSRILMRICFAV